MAHELSIRENGFVEMAFTGDTPWHGLGQELPEGQTLEEWQIAAGMDWEVLPSTVQYQVATAKGVETKAFPEQKVLFRSDTLTPLSTVGHKYKIVQPKEVLEFFRDLTENNDMKLSTAGVLFGGRRFWALAEVGESFKLNGEDEVKGNLLLTTSVDGTLATTAKFVSTRVVCNNTLSWAMREEDRGLVKVSHRTNFDPEAVKIDMDLYESSWSNFMDSIKRMSETKVTDELANQFFTEMATDKKGSVSRLKVERLDNFYRSGIGSEMSTGTVWGLLNAATEMYTHGTNNTKGDSSNKFWSAYNGVWAKEKTKAYELLNEKYLEAA